MSNGKDIATYLIAGLIKRIFPPVTQYFPPYRSSGRNIKVELDLSSYATKTNLKHVTHVYVSGFALKTNLDNLKAAIDKRDIAKLTPEPDDLAKLSNVVKNDVAKKTELTN